MNKITKVFALALLLPFAWPAYADIAASYPDDMDGVAVLHAGGGGIGGGGGISRGGIGGGGGISRGGIGHGDIGRGNFDRDHGNFDRHDGFNHRHDHDGDFDDNGFLFYFSGDNGNYNNDCTYWVPGYWDDYGQWIAGHWQSDCYY